MLVKVKNELCGVPGFLTHMCSDVPLEMEPDEHIVNWYYCSANQYYYRSEWVEVIDEAV